jgi:hypothetical protein
MSLLLKLLLYAVVGSSEWYLALRRTLACARGERTLMVSIVFLENILGLWVLANFVRESDWLVAISYSVGGALGAFLVNFKKTPTGETSFDAKDAKSTRSRDDVETLPAEAAPVGA